MKKIIMGCTFLFLSMAVFAQQGTEKIKLLKPRSYATKGGESSAKTGTRQMITPPSTLASFWSDDFSVKTNWTMTSQAGAGVWKIDTIGPIGAYKIPKILSTTHANGFATFDSDNDCSGNQIADMTTTSAINCTGHPYIFMEFQQYYRRWFDSTFVYVSSNGTTWTKFPVNTAVQFKDYSGSNPTISKVDISSVAGGQATVWLRFEFYSPSSLGSQAGCGYSWMVDDVSLLDMPSNDVSLDQAYSDFWYQGGGFYTQTPISQIVPMTFRAAISNQGSAVQTNTKLTVGIKNGSTSVYNQAGPIHPSLAYAAADTLYDTLPAFTPNAVVASYTARFEISQTQVENTADTVNNSITQTFAVSDTVFARDNGILPTLGTRTVGSVDYTGGDADGSMIGNLFLLPAPTTISSISAFIDTASTPGTTMQYILQRVDSAGGFNQIATSAVMNITSKGSLGRWITIPLTAPISVVPGNYVAAIAATGQVAGSATALPQGVMIALDKQTQQPIRSTYVYTAGSSPPAWGYITYLPMIRMNLLAGPAGIKEHTLNMSLLSAYPNPATQSVAINYNMNKQSDVVISVTDVTGKNMSTVKEAGVVGQHSTHLDLNGYAAGTYFYTITTDFGKLNGKFVVIK
jgi:hypothetical protein